MLFDGGRCSRCGHRRRRRRRCLRGCGKVHMLRFGSPRLPPPRALGVPPRNAANAHEDARGHGGAGCRTCALHTHAQRPSLSSPLSPLSSLLTPSHARTQSHAYSHARIAHAHTRNTHTRARAGTVISEATTIDRLCVEQRTAPCLGQGAASGAPASEPAASD